MFSLAQTIEQATVELTSPTTTTILGPLSWQIFSNSIITVAV